MKLSKVPTNKGFQWKSHIRSGLLGMPILVIYLMIATMDSSFESALIRAFQELIHLATINHFEKAFEMMKEVSVYFLLFQFVLMGFAYVYFTRRDISCENQMKGAMKVMFIPFLGTVLFVGFANYVMNSVSGYLPNQEELNQIINHAIKESYFVYLIGFTFIVGLSLMRFIRMTTFILVFCMYPFLLILAMVWKKEKSLISFSHHFESGFDLLIECILPIFLIWGISESMNQGWNPIYLLAGLVSLELIINAVRYAISRMYRNFKIDKNEMGEM